MPQPLFFLLMGLLPEWLTIFVLIDGSQGFVCLLEAPEGLADQSSVAFLMLCNLSGDLFRC